MNITCKNILNFPYAGQLRLVAGEEGINHVIEWVHYMEEPEYVEWLRGGELILTTGIMIGKDEEVFRRFVEGICEQNAAGLVVNIGFHIEKVPETILRLADELALPLYEMPSELRMVDLSQSICSRIVQKRHTVGDLNKILLDLIYGKRITQKRLEKLLDYNYQPGDHYCSVVAMCEELEIQEEETDEFQLFEEENQEEFLNKVAHHMNSFMESNDKKTLYVVDNDVVIMMLPVSKRENIAELIRRMIPWAKERIDIKTIRVGVGYRWTELEDFQGSVECAQHAIFFGEQMDAEECVFDYADLTAIRIFDEIKDKRVLRSIERQVLGKLLDNKDDAELLRTLEAYFNTECNAKETAAVLFIHENTMRYRLRKIENLLGRDLRRHNDVFELELAIRIKEYLEYMQYDI